MAAAEHILADSVARTASGTGEAVSIKTLSMLDVAVDITAASGTTPALTVWVEFSPDGKTNWFAKLLDHVAVSDTTATDRTGTNTFARNICSAAAAAGDYVGTFKHVAASYVRARWVISGTTPSFTFSVKAGGK